jgi:cellobiose phosphorylase
MAHAASGNVKRAWELMNMVNPVNHGNTFDAVSVYKAEPYVVAADVYSIAENRGRGGWTWYTGSAGWMYRLIVEWLIGVKQDGNKLRFVPCIPAEWKSCTVHYRFGDAMYHIELQQSSADSERVKVSIDGMEQESDFIMLADDKSEHTVEICIPAKIAQPFEQNA